MGLAVVHADPDWVKGSTVQIQTRLKLLAVLGDLPGKIIEVEKLLEQQQKCKQRMAAANESSGLYDNGGEQ